MKNEKQRKKGISIRMRLIGIIIPIVLVLIISFFALARNVVIKLSQEKLQEKSEVYTEKISNCSNPIFGDL